MNENRKVRIENEEIKKKVIKLKAALEEERKVQVDANKLKEEFKDWKSKYKIKLEQNEELKKKIQCNDNLFEFLTQLLDKQRKEQVSKKVKKIGSSFNCWN